MAKPRYALNILYSGMTRQQLRKYPVCCNKQKSAIVAGDRLFDAVSKGRDNTVALRLAILDTQEKIGKLKARDSRLQKELQERCNHPVEFLRHEGFAVRGYDEETGLRIYEDYLICLCCGKTFNPPEGNPCCDCDNF